MELGIGRVAAVGYRENVERGLSGFRGKVETPDVDGWGTFLIPP